MAKNTRIKKLIKIGILPTNLDEYMKLATSMEWPPDVDRYINFHLLENYGLAEISWEDFCLRSKKWKDLTLILFSGTTQ